MSIKYLSDNLIRLRGPVDVENNTAITAATSCNAVLFHDRKDTFLTTAVSSGTTVVVEDDSYLEVGDTIIVVRDDGTYNNCGALVSKTSGTLVVTDPITAACGVTNRVMVQLGATVDCSTAYGTAVVGTYDWGFKGTIQSSHADLKPGIPVRIEITLDASGVVLTEVLRATVTGGT